MARIPTHELCAAAELEPREARGLGPWRYIVAGAGVHAPVLQFVMSVFWDKPLPSPNTAIPRPTTPEGDPDFHTCNMSCRYLNSDAYATVHDMQNPGRGWTLAAADDHDAGWYRPIITLHTAKSR